MGRGDWRDSGRESGSSAVGFVWEGARGRRRKEKEKADFGLNSNNPTLKGGELINYYDFLRNS